MAACFDANFLSKMDGDLGGPTAISTLRPVGLQNDLRPGEFRLEGELAHRVEIKIADFGLAKHLDAEDQRSQTGTAIGTPSYMAPEQIQGDLAGIGQASDIYSIGAILYYLLVGRPPFHAAKRDSAERLSPQRASTSAATRPKSIARGATPGTHPHRTPKPQRGDTSFKDDASREPI